MNAEARTHLIEKILPVCLVNNILSDDSVAGTGLMQPFYSCGLKAQPAVILSCFSETSLQVSPAGTQESLNLNYYPVCFPSSV